MVKVYLDIADTEPRRVLIGHADVPHDIGNELKVVISDRSSRCETFAIATVTGYPSGRGGPFPERSVVVQQHQYPGALPGWRSTRLIP